MDRIVALLAAHVPFDATWHRVIFLSIMHSNTRFESNLWSKMCHYKSDKGKMKLVLMARRMFFSSRTKCKWKASLCYYLGSDDATFGSRWLVLGERERETVCGQSYFHVWIPARRTTDEPSREPRHSIQGRSAVWFWKGGKYMMRDGWRGCERNRICVSYIYQLSQSLVRHLSLWTNSLFYLCQHSPYSSYSPVRCFTGISNCRKWPTRNRILHTCREFETLWK